MEESGVRLDPLSEMLALSSGGNTKNIILTLMETTGPLDEEAMISAVRHATPAFPQFLGRLREVKSRGRHYLFWDYRANGGLPIHTVDMNGDSGGSHSLNDILERLAPHLDRDRNLFDETASDYFIVKLAPDRHVLGAAVHHAATDAATVSEFGKEVLAHYHRLKTGRLPDWVHQPHAMSSSRKREVETAPWSWRDILRNSRTAVQELLERPTLPAGSGVPADTVQYHIKRELSVEDTERMVKGTLRNGASLVDLLVARANLAVDQWNERRYVPAGLLTTSMSVNMRGRFSKLKSPNSGGLIFFRSSPHERTDAKAFARSIAVNRIKQFRRQMDFRYYQNVEKLTNSVSVLPLKARRRLVRFLTDRYQVSVAITLLGAIWPKSLNGKPSADTYLTHSADLEIQGVHGVGYKLLSSTRVLLIVYFFRNRLNLILAASACLFTRQEAEDFLDLVVSNLAGATRGGG